jgi:hypothetical protein
MMWTPSNKIIQHLVKTGKINPTGLVHFGGKQYFYIADEGEYKGRFSGNIDREELGKIITWMTNEEIESIMTKKIVSVEEDGCVGCHQLGSEYCAQSCKS